MTRLTIGKLTHAAGVSTDTIRFYERCGLLPTPERTESNYRLYPDKDILRLKFIKRAKALGFTLNEIKELLALRHNPQATKEEVKAQTEDKVEDIKYRIADLERILATLEHLTDACDGHGPADDCPILAAMDTDSEGECSLAGHHNKCRHTGT